MLQYEFVNI